MGIRWIKLDLNTRSKPEFRAILRKYGGEGGYAYWGLLQYMADQDDGIMNVKNYTYDMLADEFCIDADTLEKIIDDLLFYDLISSDEKKTTLWSESVIESIDAYGERSNKARHAANERWKGRQKDEIDQSNDDAPSICPEDIPQAYANTSDTSDSSDHKDHIDYNYERTSQDITHKTFDDYFDDYSTYFFKKPYNYLDKGIKQTIEALVDKYGIVDVGSMMYETMNADQHAGDEDFRVRNPIAYLTTLLKEINEEEIRDPIISHPPENVETLINNFDRDDKASYARLLMEYDKNMIHLAIQFAVPRAETNLLGYTRRVLQDWYMRGITTPERYHQEIMKQRRDDT